MLSLRSNLHHVERSGNLDMPALPAWHCLCLDPMVALGVNGVEQFGGAMGLGRPGVLCVRCDRGSRHHHVVAKPVVLGGRQVSVVETIQIAPGETRYAAWTGGKRYPRPNRVQGVRYRNIAHRARNDVGCFPNSFVERHGDHRALAACN